MNLDKLDIITRVDIESYQNKLRLGGYINPTCWSNLESFDEGPLLKMSWETILLLDIETCKDDRLYRWYKRVKSFNSKIFKEEPYRGLKSFNSKV